MILSNNLIFPFFFSFTTQNYYFILISSELIGSSFYQWNIAVKIFCVQNSYINSRTEVCTCSRKFYFNNHQKIYTTKWIVDLFQLLIKRFSFTMFFIFIRNCNKINKSISIWSTVSLSSLRSFISNTRTCSLVLNQYLSYEL